MHKLARRKVYLVSSLITRVNGKSRDHIFLACLFSAAKAIRQRKIKIVFFVYLCAESTKINELVACETY